MESYLEKRITELSELILNKMTDEKLTLSVAESCTAGLLASELTSISGASNYFKGGIICYSTSLKIRLLNVLPSLIEKHTAVSKEIADALSEEMCRIAESHYALAITGVAGPEGGTVVNPVGTVYISLAYNAKAVLSTRRVFNGERNHIRIAAVEEAMRMLWDRLNNKFTTHI